MLLRKAWLTLGIAAVVGCAAPSTSTAPSPTAASLPTTSASSTPLPSPSPSPPPSASISPSPTPGQTLAPSVSPTVGPTNAEGFTPDEQMLVDIAAQHISANVDGSGATVCTSMSGNLPAGATAGVECIGDSGIGLGGYYLFPDAADALTVYLAGMADEGISIGQGDCDRGFAGDEAWWVPGVSAADSPWRAGCFFQEGGEGVYEDNLRLVCHAGRPASPSPVLYVELGLFDDVAEVYDWLLASAWPGDSPRVCDGDPLTAAEEMLALSYFGVGDCSPKRTDLPERSWAAIECVVADGLVDRVGLYLFGENAYWARQHYVERLSEYDVALESGDCAAGTPGDSAWHDMDGQPIDSAFRTGCFVNENDHANVRVTCPPSMETSSTPGLYIGVLGSTGDVAALYDWTWGGAEWRDYVATWQEQNPNASDWGPRPAICDGGWFERETVP